MRSLDEIKAMNFFTGKWSCTRCHQVNVGWAMECGRCGAQVPCRVERNAKHEDPPAVMSAETGPHECTHQRTHIPNPGVIECLDCRAIWASYVEPLLPNARGFRNVHTRDLPERITEYLSLGGLWNPELMNHQKVRDMLIDARDVIEVFERERHAK